MLKEQEHNEALFAELMSAWNCSRLEAVVACEFDCETLEETRQTIAKAVTYNRLLVNLLPGAIDYMKNDRYKDKQVSEDFIQSEAKDLVEDQAWMFAYDWEDIDDYETMTEAEKQAAI